MVRRELLITTTVLFSVILSSFLSSDAQDVVSDEEIMAEICINIISAKRLEECEEKNIIKAVNICIDEFKRGYSMSCLCEGITTSQDVENYALAICSGLGAVSGGASGLIPKTKSTRKFRGRLAWLNAISAICAGGAGIAKATSPQQLKVAKGYCDMRSHDEVDDLPKTITNSIGMEFVLIPAGTFTMGSPDSDPNASNDEKPAHQLTISKPFYMGKYEVTQAQWRMVMGNNPSRFKGDDRPVETVSWEEVQTFIKKLNEKEKQASGVLCRLPTEAQWEYAARARSPGLYSFGDNEAKLGNYAWYRKNAGNTTHPVGQKQPNAWGLYDMHGNVWEWVQDWYAQDYYQHSPSVDPQGPVEGLLRVLRGGGWFGDGRNLRSARRSAIVPDYRSDFIGFRLARGQVSGR